MKNLFKYTVLSLSIILTITACTSNTTVNNALDSLDSVGDIKLDTLDSTIKVKIDTIDSAAKATIQKIKK